jgi:hypothetical protein
VEGNSQETGTTANHRKNPQQEEQILERKSSDESRAEKESIEPEKKVLRGLLRLPAASCFLDGRTGGDGDVLFFWTVCRGHMVLASQIIFLYSDDYYHAQACNN